MPSRFSNSRTELLQNPSEPSCRHKCRILPPSDKPKVGAAPLPVAWASSIAHESSVRSTPGCGIEEASAPPRVQPCSCQRLVPPPTRRDS